MILERKAPAKINLGLHVLRKRDDGYHDIETVLLRTAWADLLRMQKAKAFSFTCSDATLPVDENNLCVRAIRRLEEHCETPIAVAMHLEKVLPYGAGLGGGSSDAALALQMASELLDLNVSGALLHTIAAGLGSDIPFFLGASAAVGTGRGEKLTPLMDGGQVYSVPYSLLLVVPPVHVSTKEAYQYVTPSEKDRPGLAELVQSNDLSRWKAELVNDFEDSVFTGYPAIGQIKEQLYTFGAGYAAMSGSGSSVFGVFDEENRAIEAEVYFQKQNMTTWRE